MSTLVKSVKKARAIDIENLLLQLVKKEANYITDLNTENQLGESGIDSKGMSLGEYSPFTVKQKKNKSGLSGVVSHITLYDVGDFHRSFYIDAKFPIEIDAKDEKRDKLADVFGEDIFGLTSDSIAELNEVLLPQLQDKINV